MPENHTIPHTELNEEEKTIGIQVLNGVMANWDKLKNTSIEGLRQTFLQRTGRITFNEDKWILNVEHKGYDVLLQTLPWPIGTIKTKFMNIPLHTEWI
jgi:hypothetical protein